MESLGSAASWVGSHALGAIQKIPLLSSATSLATKIGELQALKKDVESAKRFLKVCENTVNAMKRNPYAEAICSLGYLEAEVDNFGRELATFNLNFDEMKEQFQQESKMEKVIMASQKVQLGLWPDYYRNELVRIVDRVSRALMIVNNEIANLTTELANARANGKDIKIVFNELKGRCTSK